MKKLRLIAQVSMVFMLLSLCAVPAYSDNTAIEETENEMESTLTEIVVEPEFDWDQYSLDELIHIQKDLSEKVLEKQRQYAIENGNRKIQLNEEEFTVFCKKSFTLVPTVERVVEDAPQNTSFVWTSSDNTVATVSNNGSVTGVAKGDAVITCTAKDDEYIFQTATVHVVLPVTDVSLSENEITLLIDERNPEAGKALLTCKVEPEDAHIQSVTWKSDKEEIVAVDQDGAVVAVAPGRATITAYSNEEGSTKKSTCTVTVMQAVASIELDNTSFYINKGSTKQIQATVIPENASKRTVSWRSSDEAVAKVSGNGTVTGVACGEAVITCSAEDGSAVFAESEVHIVQMVKGIKFKDYSGKTDLQYGEKLKVSAIVEPEDATNKAVDWESSDARVVKIDKNGFLEVVGSGIATIICKATDGSDVQAQLSIFVPSIHVEKESYTVSSKSGISIPIKYYGDKASFNYSISPSGIVSDYAYWSDNNKTVRLQLNPKAAGRITISIEDSNNSQSNKKITVDVPKQCVPNVTDSTEWANWKNSQFSAWNGKHIAFEDLIKEQLNDEKSYKHKDTECIDITNEVIRDSVNEILRRAGSSYRVEIGDLFIKTTFTAKNAFNATVKNTAFGIARYSTNKIVLVTIE